nr:alpha/beta hydrolase [Cohnella lubricantis]
MLHANGIELHYHVQGKGIPIVFLHPPTMGSRLFTYLRNDLARDHRTLLFDFRGHGRSASSASPITFPLLIEDTCRLMDALDIESAYLCGYSMGTMVALEALLTHPERFRGAALLSGMPSVSGPSAKFLARSGLAAASLRAKQLMALAESLSHADNPEAFQRLRAESVSGDPTKWREYIAAGLAYSATDRLQAIRQPILLLYGQKDQNMLPYARMLQSGLPNAASAWIPGTGHRLPISAADMTGRLIRGWIDFLEKRDEPREEAGFGRRVAPEERAPSTEERSFGSASFADPDASGSRPEPGAYR